MFQMPTSSAMIMMMFGLPAVAIGHSMRPRRTAAGIRNLALLPGPIECHSAVRPDMQRGSAKATSALRCFGIRRTLQTSVRQIFTVKEGLVAAADPNVELSMRRTRTEMTAQGLIHGESPYPGSFTLVTALILLTIGIIAIISMAFQIGPFG